ncbi:MAG: alpha/beta hydrolase [Bacteroidota bacterium]
MVGKRIRTRWILKILLIVFLPILALTYFIYSNDAPIIHGKIAYNIEFKKDRTLDIYFPTQTVFEKSPVLLFLHGGAWITGRKETVNNNRFNVAFNKLRNTGYTIISPEYTLAEDEHSPFPDCIIDGYDALEWVKQHSDSLNIQMNHIGIMGESAGGHIAMMMAFTSPSDFGLNYENNNFDFIIDVYGPSELNDLYNSATSDTINAYLEKLPPILHDKLDVAKLIFGFDPKKDSSRAKEFSDKFSPLCYLDKGEAPVLMIHGNADQVVPLDQSKTLKRKLDSLNIEHELRILENVNHGFIGATDVQKNDIQNWIVSFVIRHNHLLNNSISISQ